jgi:hypothetical protein
MRAVVGKIVGSAPWAVLFYSVTGLLLLLAALAICLRGTKPEERPEIIRALGEVVPWRRR